MQKRDYLVIAIGKGGGTGHRPEIFENRFPTGQPTEPNFWSGLNCHVECGFYAQKTSNLFSLFESAC